jgi:hypothetical protein
MRNAYQRLSFFEIKRAPSILQVVYLLFVWTVLNNKYYHIKKHASVIRYIRTQLFIE